MRKFFFILVDKFGWFHRGKAEEPTMAYFSILYPCVFNEGKSHLLEVLSKQPRPATICGHSVPKDLNALSYGDLIDLQQASLKGNEAEAVAETMRIICGVKANEIAVESVNKVFGFLNWVTAELTRINTLFASIKSTYESEEIQAGVKDLNFGAFGVLDWYAKRMGISNQNEVRGVAWVRILTCMKIDNEKTEYERRLRKIYQAEQKAKK